MKIYLLCLCCLLGGLSFEQAHAQAPVDTLLHVQQVVPVPGVGADELYARAREWVALTFEDAHQAVQLDDASRHVLIGSGFTRVLQRRRNGNVTTGTGVWFQFRLETRDGRYRIDCTHFNEIEGFHGGQYASQDIGFWLASAQATHEASSRHTWPGLGVHQVKPPATGKTVVQEVTDQLLESIQRTLTALPTQW